MAEAIIQMTPFTIKQTIYVKRNDGSVLLEKVPLKDLEYYISLLDDKVEKIHFFGNEKYVMKIIEKCKKNYYTKNVEFCINK